MWAIPLIWTRTLLHLWFLWYLLLLSAVFIIVVRIGVRFNDPAIWWLTIPASLVAALLMVNPEFGADTDTSIVPDPANLAYYGLFFAFGAFMYQRNIAVSSWWTFALIPAALALWAGLHFLWQYRGSFEEGVVVEAFLFKNRQAVISVVFETAYAWLGSFGLMGLSHLVASKERFWVRYMSDASYWMYLISMPLVFFGQFLVVDWPIHYHLKFLLVCSGVTLISVCTYQLVVRYTFIGRTLNGPRTARKLQGRQPAAVGSG